MELSRRRLLELGAVAVPLAALAACDRKSQPASGGAVAPAAAKLTGTVVAFHGLIAFVLDGHTPTKRVAATLIDPSSITLDLSGSKHQLPKHVSTLKLARDQAETQSTAVPDVVLDNTEYYSLRGIDVSFSISDKPDVGSSISKPGLSISTTGRQASHVCGIKQAANWNSLDWVLDIATELADPATTVAFTKDWDRSAYVQSLVMLDFGDLEDPALPAGVAEPHGIDTREWDIKTQKGTTRGFKEVVRHTFKTGAFLHITLTRRNDPSQYSTIVLDNAKGLEVNIEQTSARKPAHANRIDDLVGYLSLLDGGLTAAVRRGETLPTLTTTKICGGSTRNCSCCFGGKIVNSTWL